MYLRVFRSPTCWLEIEAEAAFCTLSGVKKATVVHEIKQKSVATNGIAVQIPRICDTALLLRAALTENRSENVETVQLADFPVFHNLRSVLLMS